MHWTSLEMHWKRLKTCWNWVKMSWNRLKMQWTRLKTRWLSGKAHPFSFTMRWRNLRMRHGESLTPFSSGATNSSAAEADPAHMRSVVLIPSSASPCFRTREVASQSTSRVLRAGSSARSTGQAS